jgi:hypothetical protein
METGYVNGYVQRMRRGAYKGTLTIDGVELEGGIEATYFKQGGDVYLWLRRTQVMEYDYESQSYITRKREPQWEAYLKKQSDGSMISFKGTFFFLRSKYSIIGIWDSVLEDKNRLNLFVEQLPMNEQTISNKINERKRNEP